MAQNDIYSNYMLQKYGTGLQTRADAAGNHAISASLTDSYAQAGQTVPAHLQPVIRELNDITSREVIMAKSSPDARAALGGSGYNPLQVRERVRELETYLYNESADVRNLSVRLENEKAQESVTNMALANELTSRTLDAQVGAAVAGFQLQQAQSLSSLNEEEQAGLARALGAQADEDGITTDEMYEILSSGDPMLMKQSFGTSDRAVIHRMINARIMQQSDTDTKRVEGMAKAITAASATLAGDQTISDVDLRAMMAGELPIPDGQNLYSVAEAMQSRQAMATARYQLLDAERQGVVQGAEYEQILLNAMGPTQLADAFAQIFTGTTAAGPHKPAAVASAIRGAMVNGDYADVAEAATEAMRQSGSDGYVEFTTPTGSTARVAVSNLLQTLLERTQSQVLVNGDKLRASERVRQFAEEQQALDKQVRVMEAVSGQPMSGAVRAQVSAFRGQASQLLNAAAMEPDPTKAAEYQTAANSMMERAREAVAQSVELYGAGPDVVEDVRQGRFSSTKSQKQALISATGFNEAGPRASSPFGQMFADMLREESISGDKYQAWANDDTKGLADLVSPAKVFQLIDKINYQVLAQTALDALMDDPRVSALGPQAVETMRPLFDGSIPEIEKLSPSELLQRTINVAVALDDMAYIQDQQTSRAQGQPPSYQKGAILQTIQDHMLRSDTLRNFYSPNGAPSREMAALMGEVIHLYDPKIATSGATAPSFEDLPQMVMNLSFKSLRNALAGNAFGSRASVRGMVKSDAKRALLMSMGDVDPMSNITEYTTRVNALEIAVLGVYADKLANPDAYRSTIFGRPALSWGMSDLNPGGPGVPGASGPFSIADMDQIRAKLREQGQNPDEILGAQ